jgi:predicted dehydrogenase
MTNLSRRSFITRSAVVAAGAALLPGLSGCKPGKVNIAFIGVGGRAQDHWPDVMTENVVALCDVNDVAAAEGFKTFPNAKRFKDFRVMFDKMAGDIDAVIIATPDHVHFPAAMAAMQLGKHVYVEKPLAHNIWQIRTLRKAAKHYNVINAMGIQGHATMGIRYVKEWYEAGILGEVKEVIAWFEGPQFDPKGYFTKPDSYPPKEEPVPATLDWDLWVGPAAKRSYSPMYLPRFWRSWYDFGNGGLGDWGCHTLDAPNWALDLGLPLSVDPILRTPSGEGFVSDQSVLKFEFAARGKKPAVTLTWMDGGQKPENRPEWGLKEMPGRGMIMVGDKMSLLTGGRPANPKLLIPDADWDHFTKNLPKETIPRVEGGPVVEWIRAIKGTGPLPGGNFEYSAPLSELNAVGILAQRLNTRIDYDAVNMKVINHPEFDQYIKEPVREGWSYGEGLWKS